MSTRKPYEDIVMSELSRLLRQELAAGLSTVFADIRAVQSEPVRAEVRPLPSLSVVIHNNAGVSVQARETIGLAGQKQLEVTIDQMVARALAGGRETSGVLRAIFGLAPGLIGR